MKFLIALMLISQAFAQETEEERRAREKILRQYGDKTQVEAIEKEQSKTAFDKAMEATDGEFEAEKEQFSDMNEHIKHINSKPLVTELEEKTLQPDQLNILKRKRKSERKAQIALLQEQLAAAQRSVFDGMEDEAGLYERDEEGNLVKVSEEELSGETRSPEQVANMQQIQDKLSDFQNGGEVDENFLSKMMSPQMKAQMAKMMKSNPMSQMSKADVAKQIEANSKGTAMGKIIAKNPKLKKVIVELMHDKDALPGMISIVNKPKVMKKYGICVMVLFVAVFILNLLNSKGNLLKRIGMKIGLSVGALIGNLAIFYFFFQKELDPTVAVLKRVLL